MQPFSATQRAGELRGTRTLHHPVPYASPQRVCHSAVGVILCTPQPWPLRCLPLTPPLLMLLPQLASMAVAEPVLHAVVHLIAGSVCCALQDRRLQRKGGTPISLCVCGIGRGVGQWPNPCSFSICKRECGGVEGTKGGARM
eukprot:1162131-Pelagomonas_calceolata.AAC.18